MSERGPIVGERLTLTLPLSNPISAPVAAYCEPPPGGRAPGGYWACVTHQQGFRNNLEANLHTSEGDHLMVWICDEHGPEAAATAAVVGE